MKIVSNINRKCLNKRKCYTTYQLACMLSKSLRRKIPGHIPPGCVDPPGSPL